MKTKGSKLVLLNRRDTLAGLRYIAKSPARKHGGFHRMTILIAKSALHYLGKLC